MRRLTVIAFVLVACTRSDRPSAFRLRIAAIGPLTPLRPDLVDGYAALITRFVFEPLAEPVADGGWSSPVSRDWAKLGSAGYRFRANPEVRFSDGMTVRPDDFEVALAGHAAIHVVDDGLMLGWREAGPSPEAQLLSAMLWRQSDRGPIGTGPFVVASENPDHILLRRRRPVVGRIAEIELVSFPTPREAFASALRGEVDMLLMPDDGQLELLSGVDRLRLIRGRDVHSVVAMFNGARVGVEDRKRLALALPLDSVTNAYGPLCRREEPPPEPGAVPAGAPLELLVANSQLGLVRAALALRRALGSRGGAVTVVTPEEAQKRATAGQFDLLITTLQTWPVELAAAPWFSGRNFTGYSNPRVDEALAASDYALAQKELAADPPSVVLCRLDRTAAIDARLFDARLGDYDMLETVADWQVAR